MPGSANLHAEFAGALLSTACAVPACLKGAAHGRVERRFAIHRNAVAAGPIAALNQRFPAVKRLVGEDFFRAMARAYTLQEPPSSPLLIYYGESFPGFVAGYVPASPLPFLCDVARLEYARSLAYHAADLEPLPPAAFAALDKGKLADFTVTLHPSVSVLTSSYPVMSIWLASQNGGGPLRHRGAESALVSRPFFDVETRRLQPGTGAFLSSLKAGSNIGGAIAAGSAASQHFSAAEALATLIGANVAITLGDG